ncbi:MAG: SURF1 family protein [Granulosicoccus sp.]
MIDNGIADRLRGYGIRVQRPYEANTLILGNRRFAPKLWAVLVYVVLLSCMLWLGKWQLDRAALKVSMQSSADAAMQAQATPLLLIEDLEAASMAYQRTTVTGTYDPKRQFLWDNRTHRGQAGYEVISLINMDEGGVALVNRGWTAPGANRQQLPDVELPSEVVDGTVTIEGYLSRPSKGFSSGDAITGNDQWPMLLQYFDYDTLSAALGEPVTAAVLQAQALGTDSSTPVVLTSRPEWLIANWQPAATGPAKHYSYAFQWFAMALALTVIFFVVNRQKPHSEHQSDGLSVS